jgi:hypothetical protein
MGKIVAICQSREKGTRKNRIAEGRVKTGDSIGLL